MDPGLPSRCAQLNPAPPRMQRNRQTGRSGQVAIWYVIEFSLKNNVMKFSPTRVAVRSHEPRTLLARRSSTTLSTTFVDKRENHQCVTNLSRFPALSDNKLP
jgi:hypothetical protein